jgi:hypothetical protein
MGMRERMANLDYEEAVAEVTAVDDRLARLCSTPEDTRRAYLLGLDAESLRAMADRVGSAGAGTMTKRQAIEAILENF